MIRKAVINICIFRACKKPFAILCVTNGSVLGPVLHLLYTSDLPERVNNIVATFDDYTMTLAQWITVRKKLQVSYKQLLIKSTSGPRNDKLQLTTQNSFILISQHDVSKYIPVTIIVPYAVQ